MLSRILDFKIPTDIIKSAIIYLAWYFIVPITFISLGLGSLIILGSLITLGSIILSVIFFICAILWILFLAWTATLYVPEHRTYTTIRKLFRK